MTRRYDADNGQVFTETTSSVLPTRPYWTQYREVPGRSELYNCQVTGQWDPSDREVRRAKVDRQQRPLKGASKLLGMCERVCTDNLNMLASSVLRELPVCLGKRIYDTAMDRDLLSLNFWKAFVCAYNPVLDNEYKNTSDKKFFKNRPVYLGYQSKLDSEFSFKQNISYTFSQKSDWLSAITIANSNPDVSDYMSLADLPNLVFLLIRAVDTFRDSIIRAWSRRVVESDGHVFFNLRILCVLDQWAVTGMCFDYLENFPALQAVGFSGCDSSVNRNRTVAGWKSLPKRKETVTTYPFMERKVEAYGIELPQTFLSLGLEDYPLLYLHMGPRSSFNSDVAYLRLLNQSNLHEMAQEDSMDWSFSHEMAVKLGWWFKCNNTQNNAKRRADAAQIQVVSKRSRTIGLRKTMDLQGTLEDVLRQYQTEK